VVGKRCSSSHFHCSGTFPSKIIILVFFLRESARICANGKILSDIGSGEVDDSFFLIDNQAKQSMCSIALDVQSRSNLDRQAECSKTHFWAALGS
jgi:hypothetical protein